jgi:tetratricopeptide (TPR) repeat protein
VACSRYWPTVVAYPECLTCYRMTSDGLAAQFVNGDWNDSFSVIVIANEDLYSVKEVLYAHQRAPLSPPQNIRKIEEMDRLYPDEWFTKFFLGLIKEAGQDAAGAAELYRRAIELSHSRNWQPFLRLAYVLRQQQRLQEAQLILHEVRVLRPDMGEMVQASITEMGGAGKGKERAVS